jgi:hypothetical protein
MDVSPMQAWDRDEWTEYDRELNIQFHGPRIFLTPLLNYVNMVQGADTWITGRELLGTHVNTNQIGLRQKYITAMYLDSREKKLVSNARYGGKVQLHEFDNLVTRFGSGPDFMLQVLRDRLGRSVVQTHEAIAKKAIFDYAKFMFLADGTKFAVGTADFSDIAASSAYQFRIKFVLESKLRMVERSVKYTQEWADWANPVPASPGDALIMTTPNVMFDIWNSDEGTFMQDLRLLQDTRIINGGEARYFGATFVDNPEMVLRNAGVISYQCGVTSPIHWGDGAPDPGDGGDGTMIDDTYLTGQSSANIVHYIQCDSVGTSEFVVGDHISIHRSRTAAWGITDGVDFLDGQTVVAEIVEVDETNERLVLFEPMTEEFVQAFTGTPNGGSEGTLYAYVTLARDIHPILVVGARGMATFAARTGVRFHNPPDTSDLPGVYRFTWDEYGAPNSWNPYIYEIIFCAASDTRGGRDAVALR